MGKDTFVAGLLVGAAALALWLDVRFPQLRSADWRRLFLHVCVSLLVLELVMPSALRLAIGLDTLVVASTGVMAFSLAPFTYAFLSGIWVLKHSRQVAGGGVR